MSMQPRPEPDAIFETISQGKPSASIVDEVDRALHNVRAGELECGIDVVEKPRSRQGFCVDDPDDVSCAELEGGIELTRLVFNTISVEGYPYLPGMQFFEHVGPTYRLPVVVTDRNYDLNSAVGLVEKPLNSRRHDLIGFIAARNDNREGVAGCHPVSGKVC